VSEPVHPLLLDTCAVIWIANGDAIADEAAEILNQVFASGESKYICPMTAWEIGMLVARGKISLSMRPQVWFERVLAVPRTVLADMSPDVLIQSAFLPGNAPRDPVDRIIAATAREFSYTVVTRDRELISYAEEGHIQVLVC